MNHHRHADRERSSVLNTPHPQPRPHRQPSQHRPPRSPSRAPPSPHEPPKTLLPPYPRQHTSAQKLSSHTSDQTYDPTWPTPQQSLIK